MGRGEELGDWSRGELNFSEDTSSDWSVATACKVLVRGITVSWISVEDERELTSSCLRHRCLSSGERLSSSSKDMNLLWYSATVPAIS